MIGDWEEQIELEAVSSEYQRLQRMYNKIQRDFQVEEEQIGPKDEKTKEREADEEEMFIRQNLVATLQKENVDLEFENENISEEIEGLKVVEIF